VTVESTRRSSDSTDGGTGDQNGDRATKELAKTVSWVDVVLVKGVTNATKTKCEAEERSRTF
jgi:hypothetical protein